MTKKNYKESKFFYAQVSFIILGKHLEKVGSYILETHCCSKKTDVIDEIIKCLEALKQEIENGDEE